MKNSILVLLLSCFSFTNPENSLYQLKLTGLDNREISLMKFKGKKIVIVAFDAGIPDVKQLQSLDTLYRKQSQRLVVVAVPVQDFHQPLPEKDLLRILQDSMKLSYSITKVCKAKKDVAGNQQAIFQWLTDKGFNRHFNTQIEEAGQVFVISETGILYATLRKNSLPTGKEMSEVLQRQVND